MKRWRTAVVVGALGALLPAGAAWAQFPPDGKQFQVNTTADTRDMNTADGRCRDEQGRCSLRAAIDEANALPGMQIVKLGAQQGYHLERMGPGEDANATGDLDITSDIVIKARGSRIGASDQDRVFDVTSGGRLRIMAALVTDGSVRDESGGAFRSAGRLVIERTTVDDNHARGDGASGGAVFNDGGHLVVRESRLTDNAATRAGGAVEANAGTTTITDSYLGRNSTGDGPGNGGALHLTGEGTVNVHGSTVGRNVAAAEGGGLWNSAVGTMTVRDSFVQRNEARGDDADMGGGGIYNDGGTLVVEGSAVQMNKASGESGSGGGILNNGGDLKVRFTSVQGNRSNRAGGGIEVVAGMTTVDDSYLGRNHTGANPGNGGGLHVTGEGTVNVHGSTVGRNVAAAEGGGLWNSAVGTMTVRDSFVQRNEARGDDADMGGGGIYNDGGTLVVEGSAVQMNKASGESGSGGGILNNGGDLKVRFTSVRGNRSNRAGGGIEVVAGMTTVDDSYLGRNHTGANPGNGGGLHVTGEGTVNVHGSTVGRNVAAAEGGGLWNSAVGTMTVRDSFVQRNEARGDDADMGGGGIYNDGGTLVVEGSLVQLNKATGTSGSGGGILNNGGDLRVADSIIRQNRSNRAGGGIEAVEGMTSLHAVVLGGNSTGDNPGNGGGLHLTGAGQVDIDRSTVQNNSAAAEGGGVWNSATGTTTVTRTDFRGNTAPVGPMVYNDGGTFVVNGDPVPPMSGR